MREWYIWRILWHVDLLLDNDRETKNETMVTARQQLHKYTTVLELLLDNGPRVTIKVLFEVVFLCGPLRRYITRSTEFSSMSAGQGSGMERVGWWVNEWVREPLRFSSCELLLLEAGSWDTEIVRAPRGRRTSAVGSSYQTTTDEVTADSENLVRDVVNWRVCEFAIALWLLVVTIS
jgi:hypothetical protein